MTTLSTYLRKVKTDLSQAQARISEQEVQIRALEETQKSLQIYRGHLDETLSTMQDALISVSLPDRQLIYVSASFETVFGYPPEFFLHDANAFQKVVHPNDLARATEAMQKAFRDGFVELEHRILMPDGQTRWIQRRAWINFNETGQPIRVNDIARDITTRKQAEEAHRASEELYRSLNDSSEAAISMVDASGHYLYLNRIAALPFGVPSEALVGKTIHDLFLPDQADVILADVQQVIRNNTGLIIKPEVMLAGKRYWFRTSIQPVHDGSGQAYAAMVYSYDITSERLKEEAIHSQNEILQQASDLIGLADTRGFITYMNNAGAKLIGIDDAASLIGRSLFEFYTPEDTQLILDRYIPQVLETGQWRGQSHLKTITGHLIDVDQVIFPIRDDHNNIVLYATIMSDITERRHAEEALRRSESYLRSLIDSQTALNIRVDMSGRISYYNQRYGQQFGWYAPSLIGIPVMEFVLEEDRDLVYEAAARCITQLGTTIQVEMRKPTQSGGYLWTLWEFSAVEGSNGLVNEIQCVGFDITKQKQAEADLKAINDRLEQHVAERTIELTRAKDRLQAIFDHSGDGILLLDTTGGIQQANRVFETQFGLLPNQYLDLKLSALVDRADVSLIESVIQDVTLTHETHRQEIRARRDDNMFFESEISIAPINHARGDVTNIVCVIRDTTERVRMENTLQRKLEEEQQLQRYLQTLHEITIELTHIDNLDQFYQHVVKMGLERLGFDRMGFFLYDEARNMALGTYGTDSQGHLQPEHQVQFVLRPIGGMWQSLQKPNRFFFSESAELENNRQVVGTGWNACVALWYGDHNLGWLAVDNLTSQKPASHLQLEILGQYGIYVAASLARRQSEEILQKTKDQLQAILDYSTASIFMKNLNGQVMLLNRTAAAELGLSIEDESKPSSPEFSPHTPVEYYQKYDSQIKETGKPISYEETVKGRTYWITKFPIFDSQNQIYALGGIAADITKRKFYEESLERALEQEKELGDLKSRFVSVASHEFRTPLASILALTETLSVYRTRMTTEQIDMRLDKIRQQVMHMKEIMEDVLQLSRLQSGAGNSNLLEGDLDFLCQEIIEDFESQAFYKGRIRYQCVNAPIIISFDHRLMRQALANLISNAGKYSPSEKMVFVSLTQNDSQVILTIKDQGIGIPAEDLKRLFEPFHRATNVGTIPGTGLGLSITKQSIDLHGGMITVDSEIGSGTTFTVTIPKPPLKIEF